MALSGTRARLLSRGVVLVVAALGGIAPALSAGEPTAGPGGELSVRVLAPGGSGVPGARVLVRKVPAAGFAPGGRTDADGLVRLGEDEVSLFAGRREELSGGSVDVLVVAQGYAAASVRAPFPRTEPVAVRLARGREVRIRVEPVRGDVELPPDLRPGLVTEPSVEAAVLAVMFEPDDPRSAFTEAVLVPEEPGVFRTRVAEGVSSFRITVHAKGFLRAFLSPPIAVSEECTVRLPEPGEIRATLAPEEVDAAAARAAPPAARSA